MTTASPSTPWICGILDFCNVRVYIDEDECLGCGACEEICAEVFRLKEETEKAEVIKAEGEPEDLIEEAMESCPAECIHWG